MENRDGLDNLRRLEEIFSRFPGIGPRQAKRFIYYLLGKPPAFIKEFTRLVDEVKKRSRRMQFLSQNFYGL